MLDQILYVQTRTLENIKDPGQIENAVKNENVEKFINICKTSQKLVFILNKITI